MDANGRWLSFDATGLYGVAPLSFDWRARMKVMLGMWVVARDGHAEGVGWGGAKLWGIRGVGQRSGPDVLVMQVIRNIAELAWAPELAEWEPALSWVDAGAAAFEIETQAAGRGVSVRFDIDARGEVSSARSGARPYAVPDGFETSPWRCDFSDHRDFGGVRLPARAVATYEFDDEPWEYLRAEVTSVEREPPTT